MTRLTLSPQDVRRLAIIAQGLEAPRPNPTKADLLETIRRITCLQLDPINVVARTQLLVLWSRLGQYDPMDLERLLWEDRTLFEYWAHAASIVLTEDFPIFQVQMRHASLGYGAWARRVRDWLEANESFRLYILDELKARGPLYAGEIADRAVVAWQSGGWSSGRNVTTMLDLMWGQGDVTVTKRDGNGYGLKKQWGLLEHQLPQWKDHAPLPRSEVVRQATERALKALGVGRPRDVKNYFIRGGYPGLEGALAELEAGGRIRQVTVRNGDAELPGPWYLHNDLLPDLERARRDDWRPQTVLLSPFDNLIADRDRTELLFDFFYRIEIYVPAAKRQYGYYAMPILHGDRLIGRIDPRLDRKARRLIVNAIHLEPGLSLEGETGAAVEGALESLATFLGATAIDYPPGDDPAPTS